MSSGPRTVEKALHLLETLLESDDRSIEAAALEAGVPLSTAHRLVGMLHARGFVALERKGTYTPGPSLLRLAGALELPSLLAKVSRPALTDLARFTGLSVHLGVFEGDMVTYVVKAEGRGEVLTREGMQLEAYCSGIGKVLLAHLPPERQRSYLAGGPFVRLTEATIVDPGALADHLAGVRVHGYARDEGEVQVDLSCVAVPLQTAPGRVEAAISLSAPQPDQCALSLEGRVEALRSTAARIERRLGARPNRPARI